ncbi:hypothetical protein [Novipirellula caenicola]|uniref:Uncharacterized protein n=1 Tax=Novipirellula caenicola TaxID=1536901 RepID=A0ABP9VL21_9BACT
MNVLAPTRFTRNRFSNPILLFPPDNGDVNLDVDNIILRRGSLVPTSAPVNTCRCDVQPVHSLGRVDSGTNLDRCLAVGALGMSASHSGTIAAAIFDPAAPQVDVRMNKLAATFVASGYSHVASFDVCDGVI